jgi:4'-phosphopantetheinyl transferase
MQLAYLRCFHIKQFIIKKKGTMPLAKITAITQNVAWALWNIQEQEDELLALVRDEPLDWAELDSISHPRKRLEWLAGKACLIALLQQINQPFVGIYKTHTGKPNLVGDHGFVSLSHSFPFAVAIFNKIEPAGIDIEPPSNKLVKIQQRFMNEAELRSSENLTDFSCIVWSAKECMYKIMGIEGVIFKDDMEVLPLEMDFSKLSGILRVDGQAHQFKLQTYFYHGYYICCNY